MNNLHIEIDRDGQSIEIEMMVNGFSKRGFTVVAQTNMGMVRKVYPIKSEAIKIAQYYYDYTKTEYRSASVFGLNGKCVFIAKPHIERRMYKRVSNRNN